jgi:hypothetical protein
VVEWASENPLSQVCSPDEVVEESVGEKGGDEEIDEDLHGASPAGDFPGAFAGLAFKEPFDGAIDELHVDGLRAGPSAPDAAEDRGEHEDRDEDDHQKQCEQECVGGEEGFAEEGESAIDDVEEDGGLAVDVDVGDGGEDDDEQVGDRAAHMPEAPGEQAGLEPSARTVGVER